ncbi:hypothetical protein QR680_009880 [Steinernema hermaphroditum]|uniref:BZIP domain-containing protein n=1 Tax=Steinernema hermaphroditum TaxID=289476 RepID=A0AA39IN82_9BILA|nr:hypothetical protein QR680_009880 [Steinernema hermaphroditum]
MAYYPPQSYYYQSAAVPPPPPGSYFHPYPNFGLPAPPIPQPQVSPPTSSVNDSGIHSQPPSPDEDDKENVIIPKLPKSVKESSLNDDERRKYREKRDRNNQAAKLSRFHRKEREQKLSSQLFQATEMNASLNRELATLKEHYSQMVQTLHQTITQLKASGADTSNLMKLLECSPLVPPQNPSLMPPPNHPGFTPFF